MLLALLLIAVAAYLFGSIPTGYLLVRLFRHEDIRTFGSGNIGATNVLRAGGKGLGAATFLIDMLKGCAAVWLGSLAAAHMVPFTAPRNIEALAALCAVIGHMFPIWLRFKGGKGVATGLGVFLPICWQAVAAGIVLWLLVVIFWRYSSLGSISAAVALPLFVYLLYAPGHAPPEFVTFGTVVISVLVLIKHRPNIARLVAGEEPRLNLAKKNDD